MTIRYRKNIDCLTDDELHEFRETLATMYTLPASDPNSFATQASFHGGPPTAYCRHGAPGFFTWHRAEIKAFEDALRSLGCNLMLPFWDWSSGPSTGVPAACREPTYVNRSGDTVPNPLYSGPRAGGGQTVRRPDIDTTVFDGLATQAQTAMSATTFSSFQSQVNSVHGGLHVTVGGDMQSVPTASYDPIFYLHHANVDRMWARWQADHPGPLPSTEATFQLPPFTRPFTTQWQQGSDVESTDALGYRYRTFCFYLPPIVIWEVALIRLPWAVRDLMRSARLVLKTRRMQPRPLEVRVFLNQPRATARTKTMGNPAFVGAFGFMGHEDGMTRSDVDATHCLECARLGHTRDHAGHVEHDHVHPAEHNDHEHGVLEVESEERFDLELDITGPLRNVEAETEEIPLKLVAVDGNGDQVEAEDVLLEEIELDID
jgi:hypothetical protein